jgi:hypothetical protein
MVANAKTKTVSGGTAFAYGEVGYIHTDGTVRLGQVTTEAAATIAVVCLAAAGVASGAAGLFGFPGCLVGGLSGLTIGKQYLAADGTLTATPPSADWSVVVGVADSATSFHFLPGTPFDLSPE